MLITAPACGIKITVPMTITGFYTEPAPSTVKHPLEADIDVDAATGTFTGEGMSEGPITIEEGHISLSGVVTVTVLMNDSTTMKASCTFDWKGTVCSGKWNNEDKNEEGIWEVSI